MEVLLEMVGGGISTTSKKNESAADPLEPSIGTINLC
jgi:hypothetical protein